MRLDDRTFLTLAKKVGYPKKEALARLRKLQLEFKKDGIDESLHDLAIAQDVLTKGQQKRYERWAEQIARRAEEELVDSAEDDDPESESEGASGESQRRVIAQNSQRLVAEAQESQDDVDALIERFGAAPKEAPPEEPPAKKALKSPSAGRVKTGSAGRVRTPSAGRVSAGGSASRNRAAGKARPEGSSSGPVTALVMAAVCAVVVLLVLLSQQKPDASTPPPAPSVAQKPPAVDPRGVDPKPVEKAPSALDPGTEPVRPRGLFGGAPGESSSPARVDPTPSVDPAPDEKPAEAELFDPKALARDLLAEAWQLFQAGELVGARARLSQAKTYDASLPGIAELEQKLAERLAKKDREPDATTAPTTPGPTPDEPSARPDAKEQPKAPPKAAHVPGQPVVERYDSGKVKVKYGTDAKDRKHGEYVEYHENGRPRVRAHYSAGELDGSWVSYWENGKVQKKLNYKKGVQQGRAVEYDEKGKLIADRVVLAGKEIFPRTQEQILAALGEIEQSRVDSPPVPARRTSFAPAEVSVQAKGLRRLRQYRYLCNLPWDVDLSYEYGELTTAGTKLLDLVGQLEHTPKRPAGCSDELYEVGYQGTSKSNLYEGLSDYSQAVDGWMDDSDPHNVDRVGHRRWILNPPMKRTAFGMAAEKWIALYAFDKSREGFPEPTIVQLNRRPCLHPSLERRDCWRDTEHLPGCMHRRHAHPDGTGGTIGPFV